MVNSKSVRRPLSGDMKVEIWPIGKPIPYARNPRRIPQIAIDKVAASIQEFGFRQPIVVDKQWVIIVGHVRLLAAQKLGFTEVPVHVATELTVSQVNAYRLADNRTNEDATWEMEALALELANLKLEEFDLDLTGFNFDEIDELLVEKTEGLTDEDEAPAVQEFALTEPGDLWILGNHRLLCGDSTSTDAVERLIGGQKADMVFTDPPYNVDYEGYTEEKLKIQGDKMTPGQFEEFLLAVFSSYECALKPRGSMYVCHPSSWQREFQGALELSDFEVRCQIIWAKNTFAWGFGRYKFQHEPIFYCHRKGKSDPWYGDKSQSTLWQEKKPAANRLHPTMKPVELMERALVNSSKAGDLILDLFGGSGSTLIACEKMGRSSRLMELDPQYCDVIVRRWQHFTGKEGHLEDGRTFTELETCTRPGRQRKRVNSAEFAESQGFSRPYVPEFRN
jgi:DNA modification methylase